MFLKFTSFEGLDIYIKSDSIISFGVGDTGHIVLSISVGGIFLHQKILENETQVKSILGVA